jgi:undecaprenyl-diphosphatase
MLHYLILGVLQGIFEWLPVSSEAQVLLAASLFGIPDVLNLSIYLHLGTALAAIVYFREDLLTLLGNRPLLNFLVTSTILSGMVGLPIYLFLTLSIREGSILLLLTGIALIMTGILLRYGKKGLRDQSSLDSRDSLFAGALQGFSIIPGFSRSGATIFAFLARKFDQQTALRVSFMMSIPAVLAANIFLEVSEISSFQPEYTIAIVTAFFVGLLSMHVLLEIAKKLNFSLFCILLGGVTILLNIWIL